MTIDVKELYAKLDELMANCNQLEVKAEEMKKAE